MTCSTFIQVLVQPQKKFKNKTHVKASICETYIVEEISIFISYYFEPYMRTRINRILRYNVVVNYLIVEIYQYFTILINYYQKIWFQ